MLNKVICWVKGGHSWDGFYAISASPSDGELYIVFCEECGTIKFVEKH